MGRALSTHRFKPGKKKIVREKALGWVAKAMVYSAFAWIHLQKKSPESHQLVRAVLHIVGWVASYRPIILR